MGARVTTKNTLLLIFTWISYMGICIGNYFFLPSRDALLRHTVMILPWRGNRKQKIAFRLLKPHHFFILSSSLHFNLIEYYKHLNTKHLK